MFDQMGGSVLLISSIKNLVKITQITSYLGLTPPVLHKTLLSEKIDQIYREINAF